MLMNYANAVPSLADLYDPIQADLDEVRRIFDDEVHSDLPFVNELVGTVRSYRGKMLRPALLLLSARAAGSVTEEHHVLGAVVEIVHMATLVHDDVLDDADERRRQPTVNRTAGNVAAILLGDHLISHAFHLCSSLDSQHASRRIAASTNTVCGGELLQNQLRGKLDVSERAYLDVIQRKTAALTAVCCELGARYAEADEDTETALRSFGLSAGMAFQIVDDVLDVAGDELAVGKTLGRDADLGKLTLPTIHCLAHTNADAKESLSCLLRAGGTQPAAAIRPFLQETQSIEYAMDTARRFVTDALSQLDCLPPSDAKSSLTSLAEFITARRF